MVLQPSAFDDFISPSSQTPILTFRACRFGSAQCFDLITAWCWRNYHLKIIWNKLYLSLACSTYLHICIMNISSSFPLLHPSYLKYVLLNNKKATEARKQTQGLGEQRSSSATTPCPGPQGHSHLSLGSQWSQRTGLYRFSLLYPSSPRLELVWSGKEPTVWN